MVHQRHVGHVLNVPEEGLARWKRAPRWLVLLIWCAAPMLIAAASPDEEFLQGLRTRRLFELAEKYCREKLTDQQLAASDRSLFTLELIRTYAEHAANAEPAARNALWKQADDTAVEFMRNAPQHPQILLIKTQQALVVLARGEMARLEAEVSADPARAVAEAREVIRQASRLLDSLEAEVTAAATTAKRAGRTPADLTAEELDSLLNNVRFHRARAARNQALSYPEGSPDRLAALNSAIGDLEVSLREVPADDPHGRTIRLELAVCQRLAGDSDAARQSLEELDADGVTPEVRLAARAERVRLDLAARRTDEALRILTQGRAIGGTVSPELDFAHLETYVALWQAAADVKQTAESEKWRNQSIAAVKLVEQTHGPYWGRRAEILLVRVGGQRGDGSLEILRRAADDFYVKGQIDEALATYDKAAMAAGEVKDEAGAFEFAYKAALVEQQRKRYAEASQRFHELSLARKDHPQAPTAHLLALVNEAQAWQADPARREGYVRMLAEHGGLWPTASTANLARLWLGSLYEREKSWQEAIAAYRGVDPNSEQAVEAIQGAERCWTAWLQQRFATGERNLAPAAQEAAQTFETALRTTNGDWPSSWSAAQREMALAAAKLRLSWTTSDRAQVEQCLHAALGDPSPPADPWSVAARMWLVVAVAGQPGRTVDARRELALIPSASSEQWTGLVQQLDALRRDAVGGERVELAKFELQVIEPQLVDSRKVPDLARNAFHRMRALALFDSGSQAEGLRSLSEFAQSRPQDGELQAELGDLLLASADRSDWERGLIQWRVVASKSQPRSTRWFKAKYSVAKAQFLLGDKVGAAKLIRYLQATEDLMTSGFQKEFLELLHQCEEK